MIYLDNAATSGKKPRSVIDAVTDCLTNFCANPGRSSHRLSIEAARVIFEARVKLSEFFGIKKQENLIFTSNATEGLNIALKGLLKKNDHVITSSIEHNSVMRPLRTLIEKRDIEVTMVKSDKTGQIDMKELEDSIRDDTKAIVVLGASNVTGLILPVSEIGEIAKKNNVTFIVDAAQTAGVEEIDVEAQNIDILVFTGHKSLYGPQGIGGAYIRNPEMVETLKEGGTGSLSEKDEQPDFMPDKFMSGTTNTPGIFGLLRGVEFVSKTGLKNIKNKERELLEILTEGLMAIDGISIFGPESVNEKIGVLSFNLPSKSPAEVAQTLNERYDIASRPGLHCAPNAHRTIGTFPTGTVRFGLSYFNTKEEIEETVRAVKEIAKM